MQKRHIDRERYFSEQTYTVRQYLIPYLSRFMTIDADTRVLEVGCGEGGNLVPFADLGCRCTGVDLEDWKIELGRNMFAAHAHGDRVTLACRNIYDVVPEEIGTFDLIFLKDTLEHIPDQSRFMGELGRFLNPGGRIFFAFPPWGMPFGGHQQICRSRIASSLPFYHLLPNKLYAAILRRCGESERTIYGLLDVKSTGIWVEQFKRYARENGFRMIDEIFYFINPNYEIKFRLKPRKLWGLNRIPWVRDFCTTAYYGVFSKEKEE